MCQRARSLTKVPRAAVVLRTARMPPESAAGIAGPDQDPGPLRGRGETPNLGPDAKTGSGSVIDIDQGAEIDMVNAGRWIAGRQVRNTSIGLPVMQHRTMTEIA